MHRLAATLVLAVLIVCSMGCDFDKSEAQALVKAGVNSSEQLASYYDSLAQSVIDTQMIAEYRGLKFGADDKKELEKEREAYTTRADLARNLKGTYVALGNLVDYDAEEEVKTATGELLTSVLKQVPHPSLFDKDLFKSTIGKIAGKLVEIQQEKEFSRNLPRVQTVLAEITEIFEGERWVYQQTLANYEGQVQQLAFKLLGTGKCASSQASPVAGFQKFIERYGLKTLAPPMDEQTCKANYEFAKEVVTRISRERVASLNSDARNMSRGLFALERNLRSFMNKKNLPRPPLIAAEVTDFSKLINALKAAHDARDKWEQAQKGQKDPQPFEPQNGYVPDYLARLLSPVTRERLKKGGGELTSSNFKTMLVDDLNRIIETGSLAEGVLSKEGLERMANLRAFVLTISFKKLGPGQLEARDNKSERTELQTKLGEELDKKFASDRTVFTGAKELPAEVSTFVVFDPAAKALVRFNRHILAFIFEGAIAAPATPSE
jgi:hypothetical protein